MALTVGTGPFGGSPSGVFNFTYDAPAHVLYADPSPRRIRAVVAGETVVETIGALMLHETGLLPVYYLPRADVRADVLADSDTTTHCPFKGDASYHHLVVGGERREDAVWYYPEPLDGAPDLSDYVAIRWDAVDEWYEESVRLDAHPRDPYHRVDALASDRHVVVRLDGQVIADSTDPVLLFETGLPPRFYLPEADVRDAHLVASPTRTSCPYKGTTSRYFHVEAGGERVEDGVWAYDDPLPEALPAAGRLAFYDDRFDVEVDGEPWPRALTRSA